MKEEFTRFEKRSCENTIERETRSYAALIGFKISFFFILIVRRPAVWKYDGKWSARNFGFGFGFATTTRQTTIIYRCVKRVHIFAHSTVHTKVFVVFVCVMKMASYGDSARCKDANEFRIWQQLISVRFLGNRVA